MKAFEHSLKCLVSLPRIDLIGDQAFLQISEVVRRTQFHFRPKMFYRSALLAAFASILCIDKYRNYGEGERKRSVVWLVVCSASCSTRVSFLHALS